MATDPSWLAEMAFCDFVEKVTFRGRLNVRNFWVKCLEGIAFKTFTGSRGMSLCGRLSPLLVQQISGAKGSANGKYPIKVGLLDLF
jgi:hypothetical protein